MTEIENMIKELTSGCGNMSTDEVIESISQHIIKAKIEMLDKIRSRHAIPMNGTTDIILTRMKSELNQELKGL